MIRMSNPRRKHQYAFSVMTFIDDLATCRLHVVDRIEGLLCVLLNEFTASLFDQRCVNLCIGWLVRDRTEEAFVDQFSGFDFIADSAE